MQSAVHSYSCPSHLSKWAVALKCLIREVVWNKGELFTQLQLATICQDNQPAIPILTSAMKEVWVVRAAPMLHCSQKFANYAQEFVNYAQFMLTESQTLEL